MSRNHHTKQVQASSSASAATRASVGARTKTWKVYATRSPDQLVGRIDFPVTGTLSELFDAARKKFREVSPVLENSEFVARQQQEAEEQAMNFIGHSRGT